MFARAYALEEHIGGVEGQLGAISLVESTTTALGRAFEVMTMSNLTEVVAFLELD
jgi:hypothetical protein